MASQYRAFRPGGGGMNLTTPQQPYYGYSPTSNYGASPSIESVGSPPQMLPRDRFGSVAPPPEVFLDGYNRPPSDSTTDSRGAAKPSRFTTMARNSTPLNVNDSVAMHLLVETALGDSQDFEVLPFEEVEVLKKESRALQSRIEAVAKKLALETKLRDAAMSLNRLYSKTATTSPRKRTSFGTRSSSGSAKDVVTKDANVQKTESELAASTKKCEELMRELWQLEQRSKQVQTRLLRHTAGILQMTHKGPTKKEDGMRSLPDGSSRGGRPESPVSIDNYDVPKGKYLPEDNFDERSLYKSPENIDGLLNSINSRGQPQGLGISQLTNGNSEISNKATETLQSVENRLLELNDALRDLITKANPSRNKQYQRAPSAMKGRGPSIVEEQLDYLDQGLRDLGAEQTGLLTEQTALQQRLKQSRSEVEGRLEAINNQINGIINASQPPEARPYPFPPPITGQGSQDQINYLDEALYAIQQVNDTLLTELNDARANPSTNHQETLTGLWQIMLTEEEDRRQRKRQRRQMIRQNPEGADREEDLSPDEDGNPNEEFTIESFSRKVQWLISRSSNLKEQQGILRRQIRQQRELNSKSDAQREEQVADLTAQLTLTREQHADAERELANVISEMDQLKILDQKHGPEALANEQRQRADVVAKLAALEKDVEARNDATRVDMAALKGKLSQAEAELETLSTQLRSTTAAREAAEHQATESTAALAARDAELRNLEGEVVRLTTEVTVAKAELDAAHGTRAQRAAEAEWNPGVQRKMDELQAEIKTLAADKGTAEQRLALLVQSERTLKQELTGMTTEYEALTREGIQMEKERDNYEALIDALRSEKEKLELELSDEKVRWLGVKSPGQAQPAQGGPEMTSVRMLREDFRKMMRERTAEGLKALRAEQEERRKLEALVRQLRKEQSAARALKP